MFAKRVLEAGLLEDVVHMSLAKNILVQIFYSPLHSNVKTISFVSGIRILNASLPYKEQFIEIHNIATHARSIIMNYDVKSRCSLKEHDALLS